MFSKELYLNSCFKIRSNDVLIAVSELKSKWEKVISDCEASFDEGRDVSDYRKLFCKTHMDLIQNLSPIDSKEKLSDFSDELNQKLLDSSLEKTELAKYDAYCYASLEVASLLESRDG
jgi:hypothetical protein